MRIVLHDWNDIVCHQITTNVNDPVLDADAVRWHGRYFRYVHSTKIGVGKFREIDIELVDSEVDLIVEIL